MKAIVFDLFGTLVDIENPTHPYQQILADVRDPDIRHAVMCRDESLSSLSKRLGLDMTPEQIATANNAIDAEVKRIFVYPEVVEALTALEKEGVLVFVSSNLARPYRVAKDLLKGHVDYWHLSFDSGVLKPDPSMVLTPIQAFGLSPKDCVMIGDSARADGGAADAAGIPFVLLNRKADPASGAVTNLVQAIEVARRLTAVTA